MLLANSSEKIQYYLKYNNTVTKVLHLLVSCPNHGTGGRFKPIDQVYCLVRANRVCTGESTHLCMDVYVDSRLACFALPSIDHCKINVQQSQDGYQHRLHRRLDKDHIGAQ